MANSDGSLKFDTQLDNSGFEKGADKRMEQHNQLHLGPRYHAGHLGENGQKHRRVHQ